MDNHKFLVVSPTYNDSENIKKFINQLLDSNFHVLIIDDDSPDGTSDLIKEHQQYENSLFLIERSGKLGYGSAIIAGFNYGVKNNYEYIVQMDADLSHQIQDLHNMINNIDGYDVIVGSRYIKDGGSRGWGVHRRLLSKYANKLAGFVTKSEINDMTTGFRIYNSASLKKISYESSEYNGYSFLVDLLNKCVQKELHIKEVPITFLERELGKSKMNFSIVLEGVRTLAKIYFTK